MLLGIDIGTSTIKVGAYAHDGSLLAHVKAGTPKGKTGGHENYLPDDLWETTAGLIKKVVSESRIEVEALAVSSMGEAGLPLDKKGSALYPIIPWNDLRAKQHMEGLAAKLEPSRWYDTTGLYPNPIHSVAKWLWLKETHPEVWQKSRVWLSVMGFVRYKLTGIMLMERTQAARTMAYDVRHGEWSKMVLELADISPDILPSIVKATGEAGEVTQEAASFTGLRAGTPVFAGGHDHICASFACGALTPDTALDSLGTAEGLTFGLAETPNPGKAGGFSVGPHVVEGHSYHLGGIYSSGGAVAWVKDLLGLKSFEDLFELAATIRPGNSPLFLAHFYGEAPPFNDASAKGAFLEVTPEHGPAQFARAVLEGVVFEIRRHIEVFENLHGHPTSVVRIIGDPAKIRLWLEIRASVLGSGLELGRYPDMVTLGAALIAGLGAGIYKTPQEALDLTFQTGDTFDPEPGWQRAYDDVYERYNHFAETLRAARKGG